MSFPTYTPDTAPEASRPVLAGARKKFGIVPAPLAKLAVSPTFLQAFDRATAIWSTTSLSALEREVVTMVVAMENGCEYCVALHTQILVGLRADPALVEQLRAGLLPEDAKLSALAAFVRAILETRGDVPSEARAAFFAAGYTHEQALEVVVGVGTYTLSTYANRLVGTELDPGLRRYEWSRPATAPREGDFQITP